MTEDRARELVGQKVAMPLKSGGRVKVMNRGVGFVEDDDRVFMQVALQDEKGNDSVTILKPVEVMEELPA